MILDKKMCSYCKMILDLESFYKDKSRPDGHNIICKTCRKDLDKTRVEKRREEFKKGLRQVKRKKKCLKCGKVKERQEFSVNYTQTTGLNSYCKKCMRKLNLERREKKECN